MCFIQKSNPWSLLQNIFIRLCFVLSYQNVGVDCKITSSTTGDKHFDKSPTKARHPRKIDLRARYWAFLFDNLRRAVDEIYETCESDQSVVECKVRFAWRLWKSNSLIFVTPDMIIFLSMQYCIVNYQCHHAVY